MKFAKFCVASLLLMLGDQGNMFASARIKNHDKLLTVEADSERADGSYFVVLADADMSLSQALPFAQQYVHFSYDSIMPGTYNLRGVPDDVLQRILDSEEVREVEEDAFNRLGGGEGLLQVFDPDKDSNFLKDINEITQFTNLPQLDRHDQRFLPLNGEYNFNFTGAGVTIFIMDDGMLPTHVEYAGRYLQCMDFTGQGCLSPAAGFHATAVASLAAGATVGIARGANIFDVKVINATSGSFEQAPTEKSVSIAGLNFIAGEKMNNINAKYVANLSYGGVFSSRENVAVRELVALGVPVVISAGNFPNLKGDACDQSPSSERSAIVAGASRVREQIPTDGTFFDQVDGFSGVGECVDVFAIGRDTTVAVTCPTCGNNVVAPGGLFTTGTSFAAPLVSGIAALMFEQDLDPRTQVVADATIGVLAGATENTPNRLAFTGFGESPRTLAPTPAPTTPTCSAGEVQLKVVMMMDLNPFHQSYDIIDACTGKVIIQKGPWNTEPAVTITEFDCLPDDLLYDLRFNDHGCNGMNGGLVGGYEAFLDDVLIGGATGNFGCDDVTRFGSVSCAPSETPSSFPSAAPSFLVSTDPTNPTPLSFGEALNGIVGDSGDVLYLVYTKSDMSAILDDTVVCTTTGSDGDVTLGVRFEQFGSFDCISDTAGTSNEMCMVIPPIGTETQAFIQIDAGSEDFTGLKIFCELQSPPTTPAPTARPTLPFIPPPGSK